MYAPNVALPFTAREAPSESAAAIAPPATESDTAPRTSPVNVLAPVTVSVAARSELFVMRPVPASDATVTSLPARSSTPSPASVSVPVPSERFSTPS